jgi:CTP:phosphocholine cytidylyltransferase-like protein
MSENTRCFMIDIKDDKRLQGKWDVVLNNEGYISISNIGKQDEIPYSGMVHLSNSDFQKLWTLVGQITPSMYYDEIRQLLDNSDLNEILESLILYLKELLNRHMDFS